MKKLTLTALLTACLFFLSTAPDSAKAELTLFGDLEIDASYLRTEDDDADRTNALTILEKETTEYDLAGRIKLVGAVRKEIGMLFMDAKAEVLAHTDGDVTTDDVWGRLGTALIDLQVGRFEAWSLMDESNDMLIVEAPNSPARYEGNYARGRFDDAGQIALHYYPAEAVGLELAAVYGSDSTDNYLGLRPVVRARLGWLEAFAGLDYLKNTRKDDDLEAEVDKYGYAARINAGLGNVKIGLSYAHGTISAEDFQGDTQPDETTDSYGGYVDVGLGKGIVTLATFYTTWDQEDNDNQKNHLQHYAVYSHPLPFENTFIRFAVSYATATEESDAGDLDSDTLGFKIRLNYLF